MRRLFSAACLVGLLALVAGPAFAAPTTATPPAKATKARHHHARDPFAFPPQIKLTADQKAKVEALKKQYGPQLAETRARIRAVLTPEQRKAAAAARHQAIAEGKKGKEVFAAVRAALNLSTDQQTQLKEAFKARAALRKEIRHQKFALLTDAQKAQIKHHHHTARK